MTSFAQRRENAGVSIADLVRDLGENEEQIQSWESGKASAPGHVLRVLQYLEDAASKSSGLSEQISPVSNAQETFGWPTALQPNLTNDSTSGTFVDNMKLPIHRWFRYSAGFSASWVEATIRERNHPAERLYDPFSGSGTSLLAAQAARATSFGVESHPFVHRIAAAKLGWNVNVSEFRRRAAVLLTAAQGSERIDIENSALLTKCYTPQALSRLRSLSQAHDAFEQSDAIGELLWLAVTSILRECSGVGTAQWQYVLPNKSKAKIVDPYLAFAAKIEKFAADIESRKRLGSIPASTNIVLGDARRSECLNDHAFEPATLVITSPPYPNNYDYADATRLEMTFWGEVNGWGDLQSAVRQYLIRSCSQHSAAEKLNLDILLNSSEIAPIRNELREVCERLAEVREDKGGKKTYHTMIAAYFIDLAKTWNSLNLICAKDASVCFVIGDSAPYGVYVPVDKWLTELALAAGFDNPRFEKIRDRNIKWKNRKHTVPLKEGRLWLTA